MSDVACRARRIGFLAGPAGSVRAYEVRRMIHQRALDVIHTSCCGSTESQLLLSCLSRAMPKQPMLELQNDWDVEL